MGDVRGETLDRLNTAVERGGHVPQRAREMPDLVAAPGIIGDFDPRADAPPHHLRAVGKPSHRTGDGSGQQE